MLQKLNPIALRTINKGIFPVNKWKGVTSAEVVRIVKGILKERVENDVEELKVGHGGTLDKTASGVLVIGLGRGCKTLTSLLHGSKSYEVQGKLGEATDTYNETGAVTHQADCSHLNREDVELILPQFIGKIQQKPPVFSALKRDGKRLSDLVLEGRDVKTEPRPVRCHSLELCGFSPPFFTLGVTCGGGFYVRSLVHDIGLVLGCYAHVTELKRTRQGPFHLEECLERENITFEGIVNAARSIEMKIGALKTRK